MQVRFVVADTENERLDRASRDILCFHRIFTSVDCAGKREPALHPTEVLVLSSRRSLLTSYQRNVPFPLAART